MAEGLSLPPLPRPTLLSPAERIERLTAALPSVRATLAGETDAVALQATLACLLWETLAQTNWCGFYRRVGPSTLAVGPYQGTLGCLRIDFARGVCGACARSGQVQRVPDVHAFPDHIACDSRTQSELVIPFYSGGQLRGVLDLDSPFLDAFCEEEAHLLQNLLHETLEQPSVTTGWA